MFTKSLSRAHPQGILVEFYRTFVGGGGGEGGGMHEKGRTESSESLIFGLGMCTYCKFVHSLSLHPAELGTF